VEEETVEDVRNVEDGTQQAWEACDMPAQVDMRVDSTD
jgi:hypothetical protein